MSVMLSPSTGIRRRVGSMPAASAAPRNRGASDRRMGYARLRGGLRSQSLGHEARNFERVVDVHDDRRAAGRCAARVRDNDIGLGVSDGAADGIVENRVTGPVQGRFAVGSEQQACDRTPSAGDTAAYPVARLDGRDFDVVVARARRAFGGVETGARELVTVARLAEHRPVTAGPARTRLRRSGLGAGGRRSPRRYRRAPRRSSKAGRQSGFDPTSHPSGDTCRTPSIGSIRKSTPP